MTWEDLKRNKDSQRFLHFLSIYLYIHLSSSSIHPQLSSAKFIPKELKNLCDKDVNEEKQIKKNNWM